MNTMISEQPDTGRGEERPQTRTGRTAFHLQHLICYYFHRRLIRVIALIRLAGGRVGIQIRVHQKDVGADAPAHTRVRSQMTVP